MDIRENDNGFYVSSQISAADFPALVKAGIRTVICNRPDGEAEGQPDFTQIQQVAAEYGINAYYIPVVPVGISENNLHEMIAVLTKAERPLLGYCRTGKRTDTIYNLAKEHMEKTAVSR